MKQVISTMQGSNRSAIQYDDGSVMLTDEHGGAALIENAPQGTAGKWLDMYSHTIRPLPSLLEALGW